ncbi:hypothetical protein M9Y10_035868 [Tritrichomonas musculus]|uniref:Glycosyl hydrolase family 36 C-terminal domain-containing protein n=1 Tax=Tritrichomonas musculus TaxID=1915356 RepID=A0ABR2GVM0_9EUKA
MEKLLAGSKISYIKWDMNRSMAEPFSKALPADKQGELFHRYILNVYVCFERLTSKFPHVIFESCSSGGSPCPNHQLHRTTPFSKRVNVAYFGTFGYELDLNKLTQEERQMVREEIKFMKEYREVIQFESNFLSWMVVSKDKKTAILGWYKVLNEVNAPYCRVYLQGLDPEKVYKCNDKQYYGSELMNDGFSVTDSSAGFFDGRQSCDFDSLIFIFKV